MKRLFRKSFWVMLAVTLLTSFSANAALSVEDAIDDLFEMKNDPAGLVSFCKENGNGEALKKFLETLKGTILYVGPVECFPQTVKDTADKCADEHSMMSGWYGEEKGGKWWEGIFTKLSEAAEKVTTDTWNKVAQSTQKLLAVAFALWLALITLPMVSSFKEQNPMEYLTKVSIMTFKVMFAYLLLKDSTYFFEFFVSPIMSAAAGFAGVSAGDGIGVAAITQPLKDLMEDMHDSLSELKGIGKILMSCLNKINAIIAVIGIDLFFFEIVFAFKVMDFWNIWVILSGCAIWVSGVVLSIAFPFRVFDAVFRLGIVLALSPLYIIAWVFPLTKDFAATGFKSVLQVAFLFVFLSIALDMCIALLVGASGIEGIKDAVGSGGQYEVAKSLLKPFMTFAALGKIFIIMVCLLFCCGMLMKVDELANQFSSVSYSSGVADQTAGKVANVAASAGNHLKSGIGNAVHERLEGSAVNTMKDPSKNGTIRQALARSYLHHRGVTNRDGSARGDGTRFKDAEANGNYYNRNKPAAGDAQKAKSDSKQAKQAHKNLRKDALKHENSKEMRGLYKKAQSGTLSEKDQNRLNELESNISPELAGQIRQDARSEMRNPHKERAHDLAGAALRAGDKQREFNKKVGKTVAKPFKAVGEKASEIRGKQKEFHHKVGQAIATPFKKAGEAISESKPVQTIRDTVKDAKEYRENRSELRQTNQEISENLGHVDQKTYDKRDKLESKIAEKAPGFISKLTIKHAEKKGISDGYKNGK